MTRPFHLGLRHDRHMVSLIKQAGRSRETLGVAYPQDADRRARILAQWGINAQSPRRAELATIDIPLPQRAQAILAYQVNPAVRHQINTGMAPLAQSRRDDLPGIKDRMHLGTHRPVMPVLSYEAPRASRAHGPAATAPQASPAPRQRAARMR